MPTDPIQQSPLDPFLAQFLAAVTTRPNGFTPGPDSNRIAEALDVERSFIDMLFASARMRGLVKPVYGRGSKVAWAVAENGLDLVDRYAVDRPEASASH